ncbi:Mobile element protein (plasmid) [Acidisarcina polymorpha]|uniref:Mobile element protein n=1 Tax=Acidisarcina polymorpha TaxID=2211140 RepID=A0A2Z5GBP4_9BACT|nr:hypothetical protein [Acidisarcina polymorpha]AXC16086.1 Mobile element protein [Acidisarcina polymorpha]
MLTVVDQFTRECLTLFADTALSGEKVATALDKVVALRGAPQLITVDNVLTQEGKAGEKRRSLSIPYGMCLTTTVPPSGFHEQGLSVRP